MAQPDDDAAEGDPVADAAGHLRRVVGVKPDGRRISYYVRGTADSARPATADPDE
ncbi:MAG TPA: hypothetical protein VHW92_11715 [Mycobacteriales bacterium]|jgi:hypothetical protein|nr:hypothetical protein [Mycobacteriales bacterium]